MTVIKDGTGQGFLAGVSDQNRLRTEAVTTSDASETTDLGFGFMTNGTTLIAQTEKTVVIIVNTGIFTYEIGRVWLSVQNQQPPSTTSSTITTVRLYVGEATATLGTLKTPVNVNTGSLSPAFATVRADNPTIAGTDSEVKQLYFLLDDSQLVDFEGSIILQPTGSFRVTCTGGAGISPGTLLCAANVQFYQELG
jgi:hypothetical protein